MKAHAMGPAEDKGPLFFLVFELGASVWDSRAYWSMESANKRAAEIRLGGKMAFVEAR